MTLFQFVSRSTGSRLEDTVVNVESAVKFLHNDTKKISENLLDLQLSPQ